MTIGIWLLDTAFTLSASIVFGLFVQAFFKNKIPALASFAIVSSVVFFAGFVLQITDGMVFVLSTALSVFVNESVTLFSVGVFLFAVSICLMIAASVLVMIDRAMESF